MSKKCFFIAPIGQENSEIRKRSDQIFSYVIKPAAQQRGYEAIRGDHIPQPGSINSQVIEHLMEDDIAIADLTGNNPNVYYELAIRHGVNKPVINIKDVSGSLAFDIVGMRTIDVDFRYIDSMKKCKKEIIRQIQTIEDGTNTIDSPIKFTKQARRIDNSISDMKRISSEIESLRQGPTSKNKKKVKNLTGAYNSKIIEAIKDLPKSKRVNDGQSKEKSKNHVLWVDDYPANNRAIMDVYRRLGVEFDLVVDSEQALDQLGKKSYDLIISDIGRHSEHDAGIKMIHEMKTKYPELPPIIIYSGDTTIQKYGTNALDVGASLATASARDLVLKMNEILKLE
jgi:CheY-like chemotaxis protein